MLSHVWAVIPHVGALFNLMWMCILELPAGNSLGWKKKRTYCSTEANGVLMTKVLCIKKKHVSAYSCLSQLYSLCLHFAATCWMQSVVQFSFLTDFQSILWPIAKLPSCQDHSIKSSSVNTCEDNTIQLHFMLFFSLCSSLSSQP